MTDRHEYLKNLLFGLDLPADDAKIEQLIRYFDILIRENEQINLTAITEFEEAAEKHFADSALLGKAVELNDQRLIDVGTGAGFPGLVLKILWPSLRITLLDSLNKRIAYLERVCEALSLTGVAMIHARAEDGGRNEELRDGFDLCVSRAVSSLPVLSEYCLPFLKPGGRFFAYKGGDPEEEIKQAGRAVNALGTELGETYRFELPVSGSKRTLIEMVKTLPTPKQYPRKAGIPQKRPLI